MDKNGYPRSYIKTKRKTSMTDQHFIVDCGIYPFDIFCYFGNDRDNMLHIITEEKGVLHEDVEWLREQDYKSGKSVILPSGQLLLWMPQVPNSKYLLAVLAHEIFHCACFVVERVGIVYEPDVSDEAYAYLLQHITEKIYDNLTNITIE